MDPLATIASRIEQIRSFVPSSVSRPASTTDSAISPFSSLLAQALGTADDPTSTSALLPAMNALAAPGMFASLADSLSHVPARSGPGPIVPPADLVQYGNGRIPLDKLVSIGQGDQRLAPGAAMAFRAMATDAARDGVNLKVTQSYRSLDQQESLVDQLGRYADGGLAADPGASAHGWGLAIDLDNNARTQNWMRANAARYGFSADVAREPWHFTYRPTNTTIAQ